MAEAFLVAENLRKSFNEHKAVNGVSFTINKGEIFGLIGPNGAGKTTTIRILSTVLQPDRGDVTIGGYSMRHDADAVRSLIGVCPHELALYADLSALDNLVFFGRMSGLSGKETRAQAMANLELMGLVERAKGKVDKFSGGMKRPINLAIALMGHPELLFLDEPTVGIDPQSRNNIYETIEGLRDRGVYSISIPLLPAAANVHSNTNSDMAALDRSSYRDSGSAIFRLGTSQSRQGLFRQAQD
ncbi:MAG: ABC transporter ATP-binding protein [Dehalococcoidia bacterium]|nr:ABC transporter ATP-binding protein [Dehalococcoidia bacterium]